MSSRPIEFEVDVSEEPMDVESQAMIPADKFVLPSRAEEVVQQWRAAWEEKSLTATHFQDHWRITVPRLYSPQPNRTCLDWNFDEELANKLLIGPLEQFIWGSCEGGMSTPPRRSMLCGRVFKPGEPAYSCRECGMDNTCVLCVECFKVSPHRHHKYKMGQSGGGGCCDCGDTEAWKRDPFCELHAVPPEEENNESHISPEILSRMKIVANVVFFYSFRLLMQDHAPDLPNDLRLKDAERDQRDPLQILDQPDCYCTVLYNDETHTFEQVITTLTRVMKCNHRDSVELVSLIDREGRAIVKCSSFQLCDKLKTDIETGMAMFERFTSRQGSTLKLLVMHAHVIAHQIFAMKLLSWLQSFVSHEPSLRLAVSRVALGEEDLDSGVVSLANGVSAAASVMQNDYRMWKAARTAWHRVLIATTLMDYSTKKSMAVLFTKNYTSILKDFIRDDHDHSFSISSLSVQLFTTPTLAHYLIAKHDAMFVVMNTFVSECMRRLNKQGRLEFERSPVSYTFKRAQFVLYDVKYLLGAVPTTFEDDLRKGFLHGLYLMFNLLVVMQGMDSVVRQTGQHMEYEPEWESAFNLHVKLAHSITLALEWCSRERALCASAYRMALRKLTECYATRQTQLRELGNHSAMVIPYDVSKEQVSIHQPLSRFIAGLHLQLHKHGLSYHSPEFDTPDKLTPEELIEPILRTCTMIAQVHAGMWRRNGFALLNQLYFYHNVKCRVEMLDRDIVMMQIGASLIESNQFIIHVLNKFNLLDWADNDFEQKPIDDDTLRQTISLVEEFLGLLITVVGSRYVPGVGEITNEDRTKKEIIQILCVKPTPHSELNRSLPEDQLHETGLEAVIRDVADFVKPAGGNNRGIYKLKPHLYDEYDTFFYHYTKEDFSRSEEEQRNRRKAAGLPECCPPPPLPKLAPPFHLLANLLQCDIALHVLCTVLRRALDLKARSFSETQVHKALHLIGYALRDEESSHYEFLAFSEKADRFGLLTLLKQLVTSPRVEAHRPLAKWVLSKMMRLLGYKDEHLGDGENMDTEEKPSEKSADAEKSRRAKLAAERRAKLMAQMKSQMNNFISKNATMFEETNTEVTAEEQNLRPLFSPAGLGVWGGGVRDVARVCIMCQEEAYPDTKGEPLVMVAFVQNSTVMNRLRSGVQGLLPDDWNLGYLPQGVGAQPHFSVCGHVMHDTCRDKYLINVKEKESRRPYRLRQPAAFDIDRKEFLCPLCERLCNCCIPLIPSIPHPGGLPPPLSEETYSESVKTILKHLVSSEAVHVCTESCEEMHCQARARSVDAMSTEIEEVYDYDTSVLLGTNSRNLLPTEFLEQLPHNDDLNFIFSTYSEDTRLYLLQFVDVIPFLCGKLVHDRIKCLGAFYRCVAYTVLSSNAVLIAEKRPLLGDLPSRIRDALHVLIRFASILPPVWCVPKEITHIALRTLHAIENTSPFKFDAFSAMVTMVLTYPSIFGGNGVEARPTCLARQVTLQAFRATLTRSLMAIQVDDCTGNPMEEDQQENLDHLLPLMNELRRGNLNMNDLNPNKVWSKVKTECHGFLRCCSLFYHFLSDIPPSDGLMVHGGDTWEVLCDYLAMPTTFVELFNAGAQKKAKEWSLLSNDWFSGDIPINAALEPLEPPNLISLPDDFSELVNVVSEFTCPNSEREDSKYPTMCLVCAEVLCSQSYCCQTDIKKVQMLKYDRGSTIEHVGAVVAHCMHCGAGSGVFLRVRECEALLISAPSRGTLLPAPYIDSYGETDQGLRRGNPLTLCKERYAQLRILWLSHSLHERIARSLDSNMLVTAAWQNM